MKSSGRALPGGVWWFLLGLGRLVAGLGKALLREWRPLLAGVVLALLARAFVVDIYGVRKLSMEPTLHADEGGRADQVAVFKLAWRLGRPRRWDLCVFQRGRGHYVVKRVAGLPGEWVRVEDGDLLVGSSRSRLRLLKKSPEELARLLVPLADFGLEPLGFPTDPRWEFDPGLWSRAEDGALVARPAADRPAALAMHGLVHGGYLDPDGGLQPAGSVVRDFGCRLEWEPGEPAACLRIRLEAMGRAFVAEARAGRVTASADGTEILSAKLPAGAVRLAFIQADLRLFLWVGEESFWRDLGPWPDVPSRLRLGPRWNGFTLEVAGGSGRVGGLRVVRDLHYTEVQGARRGTGLEPEPCGPGEYYLLGDNSGVSEDSRHYGPVAEADFVGRPFLVVFPVKRMKWL